MTRYPSIDVLQKALGEGAFAYAADRKKAAGRALGTFVEIIAFYLLKSWGLERFIAIERGLQEFANPNISHNVEFTLHNARRKVSVDMGDAVPITARKILGAMPPNSRPSDTMSTGNTLLSSNGLLKNACTIAELDDGFVNAYLSKSKCDSHHIVETVNLDRHPIAMFECKRVGVEEGQKKGPQTIEKAKQGAYVARTVSSLQRVRLKDGRIGGFIENRDGSFECGDYYAMLNAIVSGKRRELLDGLTLTVGIVSNHGNWFTSGNRNKELEVLAQSYDWLLFLTDDGLAQFINEMIFAKENPLPCSRKAFFDSYSADKKLNRFTKSKLDVKANAELTSFFGRNSRRISRWFNMISPAGLGLADLKSQLLSLVQAGKEGS